MNAGYFRGRKSLAKRRNGESGLGRSTATHTTDAHERGKDFLNAAEMDHSCGYYLADKGMDLRTMQDYLGHRARRLILIVVRQRSN